MSNFIGEQIRIRDRYGEIISYNFSREIYTVKFSDKEWLDITAEAIRELPDYDRLRRKYYPTWEEKFAEGMANANRR